jgi:hypothetical protein
MSAPVPAGSKLEKWKAIKDRIDKLPASSANQAELIAKVQAKIELYQAEIELVGETATNLAGALVKRQPYEEWSLLQSSDAMMAVGVINGAYLDDIEHNIISGLNGDDPNITINDFVKKLDETIIILNNRLAPAGAASTRREQHEKQLTKTHILHLQAIIDSLAKHDEKKEKTKELFSIIRTSRPLSTIALTMLIAFQKETSMASAVTAAIKDAIAGSPLL